MIYFKETPSLLPCAKTNDGPRAGTGLRAAQTHCEGGDKAAPPSSLAVTHLSIHL